MRILSVRWKQSEKISHITGKEECYEKKNYHIGSAAADGAAGRLRRCQ